MSGALFGIEVLYLGQIDYTVIFPALVAGIVAHLVCGVRPPFPALQEAFADTHQARTILITLACGALFGLIALLLIESLRFFERMLRRFERRPYLLAAAGGTALVLLYLAAGDSYAGLGTDTINGVLAGTTPVFAGAFLLKILATSITLETGGSGGIVTPIFFVGATSGAAWRRCSGCRRRSWPLSVWSECWPPLRTRRLPRRSWRWNCSQAPKASTPRWQRPRRF